MGEIQYLSAEDVIYLLDDVLARDNEPPPSCRDHCALESAVNRCRHAAIYAGADLIRQAIVLAEGIALSHPFVDGNKRASFAALENFLRINGFRLCQDSMIAARYIEEVIVTERGPARESKVAEFEEWAREAFRIFPSGPDLKLIFY